MEKDYSETADMLGVLETIIPAPSFFLTNYFKGESRVSEKQDISFDEVLEGIPFMAPYVYPDLPGKPQNRQGYQKQTFTPAYVKPRDVIKGSDLLTRRPGEPLGGNRSLQQRMDDDIIIKLKKQKEEIYTRLEYMAARALIDGKIKIEGEDYPTQIVDFNRDQDHTVIISNSSDKWSSADADISAQLEEFSLQILSKTGYAGTDVIMSPKVWRAFQNNKSVLRAAELRRGVTDVPALDPQAAKTLGAQYKGKFGSFSIFVYSLPFKEQDGKIINVLGDNDVVFIAPPDEGGRGGVEGIKAFGAIRDVEALYPTELYPKQWIEKNPGVLMLMTQSAPLMIPGRPNATLKARVM